MFKSLLMVAIVLSSAVRVSAQESARCQPESPVIVYMNGVAVSPIDAYDSVVLLNNFVDNEVGDQWNIEYKLAYNYTDGLLLDVIEAAAQLYGSDYGRVWHALGFAAFLTDSAELVWLQRILAASESEYEILASEAQRESDGHAAELIRLHDANGRKLLVVAHSQGNLFAKASLEKLPSHVLLRTKLVRLAFPGVETLPTAEYTTLVQDKVIEAVRLARRLIGSSEPPPANQDEPSLTGLVTLGHYLEDYLAPTTTFAASNIAFRMRSLLRGALGLCLPPEGTWHAIVSDGDRLAEFSLFVLGHQTASSGGPATSRISAETFRARRDLPFLEVAPLAIAGCPTKTLIFPELPIADIPIASDGSFSFVFDGPTGDEFGGTYSHPPRYLFAGKFFAPGTGPFPDLRQLVDIELRVQNFADDIYTRSDGAVFRVCPGISSDTTVRTTGVKRVFSQ